MNTPLVNHTTFSKGEKNWYHPVLISPSTIGGIATQSATLKQALNITKKLSPDDYLTYLNEYYEKGLNQFGENWNYSDIVTVLYSAAKAIQPLTYLEVGVRRGRSMAMVASLCPQCEIYGFDMWISNYAGMENPGPEFVQEEMKKLGYQGSITMTNGNSHETLVNFFEKNMELFFDMMTIDGDHTKEGALKDFQDCLPRLKVGGAIIFDDIVHPQHPYLEDLWNSQIKDNPKFSSWEFKELGYGVGLGIKKEE